MYLTRHVPKFVADGFSALETGRFVFDDDPMIKTLNIYTGTLLKI